jgi:RNA polymerase sigma-70 factor (ECF subfamily)
VVKHACPPTLNTATVPPDDAFSDWSIRLRSSDRRALAELFEAMHMPLLRYGWTVTKDESVARDVVQEVFIKIWTVRRSLDADRSLKALLYTMVRRRALNLMQKENNRRSLLESLPDGDGGSTVEEKIDARRLGERMRSWIDELPERRREAFELSRFQGLSHAEIADLMKLTLPTVNTHIVLALKHLRSRLDEFNRSDSQS